jgi:protein-L-isoaspartate O-methyltransferase
MRDWILVSVPGKRLLYAATVFWSALLLLLVQPVLTKAILPWFGGSAGVWTTSMLFYQSLLLLGYAYAHFVARRLTLRMQVALHTLLLIVSLLLLPLRPSPDWKPSTGDDPVLQILGLLFTSVGLPYFLLSATSPLVQSWFARNTPSATPYRLFALSNLGSLVALLSYPAAIEPILSTRSQMLYWTIGYVVFAILCCAAAYLSRSGEPVPEERFTIDRRAWTWLALAACPSILWLAVANQLSQDVAAIPFLWVVPLSLYLFSFVLCFDNEGWYRPRLFRWLLPVAWVAVTIAVAQQGYVVLRLSLLMLAGALFVICMFCHGELARLRPEASQLTAYYLTLSGGGALGGLFVGLLAPRMFNEYLELPIGVLISVILALWLLYALPYKRVLRIGAITAAATIAAVLMPQTSTQHFVRMRNFYGTLQVTDTGPAVTAVRTLFNGSIQHGVQFLAPERSRLGTTYYGVASGVAIAINTLRTDAPMRVGVIGLGTGTLAVYGKPNDVYRFYEINPSVVNLANVEFRYLRESRAKIDVVTADARLSLEREAPQNFDVLAVDAFAGDSIPVHLLTVEAFDLYFHHLKPTGALAIHVTNKHLDLAPVVQRIAKKMGANAFLVNNSSDGMNLIHYSSWVIVSRNPVLAKRFSVLASPIRGNAPLWTDDYSNLLRILR